MTTSASTGTIPQLLAGAARRFPDGLALIDHDERWTFADLEARVHGAARALLASGVAAGERIGVWAPNIPEWVVAALAVYSVGAVLIPINTRFKAKEAAYILGRARVRRVFTVTDFLGVDYVQQLMDEPSIDVDEIIVLRGPTPRGAVALADFVARGFAVDDTERRTRADAVGGADLCHILFTSGTTGAPKGVMLEHGPVCDAFGVYADFVGLHEGDRYLVVNPFFHSFGLHAGLLCCLMKGATLLPLVTFDPLAAMQVIEDEGVTTFPGPPTVYQTILNHPELGRFDLSTLRSALVGAAVVPVQLIEEMRERLAMDRVTTGYGLTEASGIVSVCHHGASSEVIGATVGRALPGVELRIVDDEGDELPQGEPGELLVRGYNVMRGYLDDPEATAAAIDSDGWLRTGDIALVREDGNLVITDRKKDMFIVGGFNAYPAEIEQAMLGHPDVAQVAVVGVPDDRLGEIGMAFVIARQGAEPDAEAIIEWCRGEFANYKVPRRVVFVDQFPLNATGKVLKYELRELACRQDG